MADDFNATERSLLTSYPVIPETLAGAEFIIVRFGLDLLEPCHLGVDDLLGLRRALHKAGLEMLGESVSALFDPPLSSDPTALKRFQKSSPAFVLRPDPLLAGDWREGDRLELEVLFLGTGITSLGDFFRIMQVLGGVGLADGRGSFDLAGVKCLCSDGSWRRLSGPGGKQLPAPDLLSLGEWLDSLMSVPHPVLEFLTPARLVAGARGLRQPRFTQLFPFFLRRVTSMLYYHCGLEPVDDPGPLLLASAQVEAQWLEVRWNGAHDAAGEGGGRAGGLTGRLRLDGVALEELMWVVALATLFGVGKGAAWGSGHCRLIPMG